MKFGNRLAENKLYNCKNRAGTIEVAANSHFKIFFENNRNIFPVFFCKYSFD